MYLPEKWNLTNINFGIDFSQQIYYFYYGCFWNNLSRLKICRSNVHFPQPCAAIKIELREESEMRNAFALLLSLWRVCFCEKVACVDFCSRHQQCPKQSSAKLFFLSCARRNINWGWRKANKFSRPIRDSLFLSLWNNTRRFQRWKLYSSSKIPRQQ